MSYRGIGFGLVVAAGLLLGPGSGHLFAQNETNDWGYSGNPSINTPLPLGPSKPESGGIYGAAEFLFMRESNGLGHQTIAIRGFVDTNGSLTGTLSQNVDQNGNPIPNSFTVINGTPGTFVGSGADALDTTSGGRQSWTPGFRFTIGYKLEDGDAISFSYQHLAGIKTTTEATGVQQGFQSDTALADSYLYSPVWNFSPAFSGPPNKVQPDPNRVLSTSSALYGIWDGANQENTVYIQRYDNIDLTYRRPVFDTDWSRTYALAGVRRAWIWESFSWLVIDTEYDGSSGGPLDQAKYDNILSQVMYGPFIGVGNEVYLGNSFALSGDVTAAALLDIVKEEAKYELMDGSTESKRGWRTYSIVPNVNANINLWWYPIEGVAVRAGYNVATFFNTMYMQQPVSFNVGGLDPPYAHKAFRIMDGFQFGISYTF